MKTLAGVGLFIVVLVLGYVALVPAQALVMKAWVWEASETPTYLEGVLKQNGWTLQADRQYYFIHYSIQVRSLLPVRLSGLQMGTAPPTNSRIYEVAPDFIRSVERFQRTSINGTYLVELAPEQDINRVVTQTGLTIRVGDRWWPRTGVKIAPDVTIIPEPAVDRR